MFGFLKNTVGITEKEYGYQMHFHGDNSFEIRRLELEDTLLIEKKGGKEYRYFLDYYKLRFLFNGYKGIPPCMLTLSHDRDAVLDPFGILTEEDGFTEQDPSKNGFDLNRPFLTNLAINACYKAENQPAPSMLLSKFEWALSITLGLQGVAVLIMAIT